MVGLILYVWLTILGQRVSLFIEQEWFCWERFRLIIIVTDNGLVLNILFDIVGVMQQSCFNVIDKYINT